MALLHSIDLDNNCLRDAEHGRDLTIAAIQLDSPFKSGLILHRSRHGRQDLRWDSESLAEQRIDKVQAIISRLKSATKDGAPDVVLFPEYALPEAAHQAIDFQAYADENRCIIAPGTYYCTSNPAHLVRRNVCKIYIPSQPAPIVIVKRHPTPTEEVLFPPEPSAEPNVLQLLWRPFGRQAIALNFFICRDYLLPVDGEAPLDAIWKYEGISFVIAHNNEPRLFEGQAALDARRLRGAGRFVLLANSAKFSNGLATALLGPASPAQRERDDVIVSVPAESEAMLVATVRPWDVRYQEIRPDKKVDSPIKMTRIDEVEERSGMTLLRPEVKRPTHRAVWKPAFLEAVERVIVLDFRVASNLARVGEALKSKMRHVHVGLVTGVQDVMMRRYAHRRESPTLKFPPFASDWVGLSKTDEDTLFETREAIRILIPPANILKYRGIDVSRDNFDISKDEISENLVQFGQHSDIFRYHEHLRNIAKIATEFDPDLDIPKDFRVYFMKDLEETIPIGKQFQNHLVETHLLLAVRYDGAEHINKAFEREVIRGMLMDMPAVREIFRVATAEPAGICEYVIKIKADTYETWDIKREIFRWHSDENVKIFSRSFSVSETVIQDSIMAVANFDSASQLGDFRKLLLSHVPEHSRGDLFPQLIRDRLFAITSDWYVAQAEAKTLTVKAVREVHQIYVYLYLIFALGDLNDEDDYYYSQCKNGITNIYQRLEELCGKILSRHLDIDRRQRSGDAVERLYPSICEKPNWQKDRPYSARILFNYLDLIAPDLYEQPHSRVKFNQAKGDLNRASEYRNLFVHGDNAAEAREALNLSTSDWKANLARLKIFMGFVLTLAKYGEEIERGLTKSETSEHAAG